MALGGNAHGRAGNGDVLMANLSHNTRSPVQGVGRPANKPETFDDRLRSKLYRDLGPEISCALQDPLTVEVMVNPDGRIWQERLGEAQKPIGQLAPARAEAVLKAMATHLGLEVTRGQPLLEGELPPDGARFAGQIPPIAEATAFAIRVPATRVFSLAEYVEQGSLTTAQLAAIKTAVGERKNILVVGGTGSGKTTLVNAIIGEMTLSSPGDRVIIIEDSREIQCTAENCVQYKTLRGVVSIRDLVRTALRMRPDRILVGEVRSQDALDLLMAWNTGHNGGAATVHANSAYAGLERLEWLISLNPQVSPHSIPKMIAEAVDVVIYIARTDLGRRVQEVLQVTAHDSRRYTTQPL